MKVAIIGASGFIGSAILQEALDRGHQVTAIVRNPDKITITSPQLTVKKADAANESELVPLLKGQDAVISAYSGKGADDIIGAYQQSTNATLRALKQAGVKRLLYVGGAASLETAPGQYVIDSPHFPEEWKPIAKGTFEAFNIIKQEQDLDWTVLSPAAMIQPGERTGKFRLGKDNLVVNDRGESTISSADYAVALIDELEQPKHIKQRFTLAY